MEILKTIKINRKLEGIRTKHFSHTFPNWRGKGTMIVAGDQVSFNDIFVNFDKSAAIRKTLGKDTEKILSKLDVGVYNGPGYLWIDDHKGRRRLMASRNYIQKGRKLYIYLDVVHELVHIRQHAQGTDLWNEKYDYLERPTEIAAYTVAAREGKRLGMSAKQLRSYLHSPWESRSNNKKFYLMMSKAIGIK